MRFTIPRQKIQNLRIFDSKIPTICYASLRICSASLRLSFHNLLVKHDNLRARYGHLAARRLLRGESLLRRAPDRRAVHRLGRRLVPEVPRSSGRVGWPYRLT